ncbi:MAG: hypothetical protein HC862_03735 [Scytonema sp. RU_4_4]|nr:hypothetical protein [Scytonema sp. RU_4_4]
MSSENAHQIYSRLIPQEFEHSELGYTRTNLTRTVETVNDGVKRQQADSYQDGYFQSRVEERCYQEEGKADRHNSTTMITLMGSFILMVLVSLVASTLFPAPRTQRIQDNSTNTWEDITPITTPMQNVGIH